MNINPKLYHFTDFELINPLLYIYFPSFECKFFLKDLKSMLPSSVALWFLNMAINRLTTMVQLIFLQCIES